MARSRISAVVFVIVSLLLTSLVSAQKVSNVTASYTLMNYLKEEDFMTHFCMCIDAQGQVSAAAGTISNCVDKEVSAAVCPTGVEAITHICCFKYYQRDRTVDPVTIIPWYVHFQVWANTGPAKTYIQLDPKGIFATPEYPLSYYPADSTKVCEWRRLFDSISASNVKVLKYPSVGNGKSF